MTSYLLPSLRSRLAAAAIVPFLAVGSVHAGLIAQYTFDDADIVGTAAQDDKVGSNDTSEPLSAVSTGATGQFGQAYNFNGGANNLMTVPAGVVPSGAAERTISIWFNQTADTTQQDKIWGYGAGTSGNAFDMSLEDGGIRLRHFGGYITWGSGFDFDGTDAGWHHLAVRVNASASTFADVDVFLDGTKLSVTGTLNGGTGTTLNTTDSVFGIGTTPITAGTANVTGFKGLIDELRIYDNALTDQDIADLADPGTTAPPGIISITKVGTTVTVQFSGNDGQTYDLNKSPDLDFSVPDIKDSVTLSGTTGTLEDTTATESAAFYRVEEQ